MNAQEKSRYLTKSRFKLALECPTKLYYSKPSNGYFDKNQNNDFLQALADGGNQVGEIAKFKYHPNPIGDAITVDTLDYEQSVDETKVKLAGPGRVVIAEAALLHAPFFVRIDILIRDEASKTIEIVEVKSKSVTQESISSRFQNSKGQFDFKWLPYLYDVTFQAEVARLVFPGYQIRSKLLLLDASVCCEKDGVHQLFQITAKNQTGSDKPRVQILTPFELTLSDIGSLEFLREVEVSEIVADLRTRPINNTAHVPEKYRENLITFMNWTGEIQMNGGKPFHGVSKACKNCQFRASDQDTKRSGVHECWQMALNQGLLHGSSNIEDRSIPLSIDLWGGATGAQSIADTVLGQGRAFLENILEEDILPRKASTGPGMSPFERRMAQIHAYQRKGQELLLDMDRLSEMDEWQWPLHMIDFETSAPALPFFKTMKPYETLAFQFSHHVIEKKADGSVSIRHANQWISTEAGRFPSIEFVRALSKALMPDGKLTGTVFRYHNHENTVLRSLRQVILQADPGCVPDAKYLIDFIDLITKATGDEVKDIGEFIGARPMVDLHRLIQEGYYSKHAGGSISLKFMLPAVLKDAQDVANLYRKPGLYGAGLAVESLNFQGPVGHTWLQADKGDDPYKTLPGVFGADHGVLNDMLMRLAGDDGEDGAINQGGLAMTAYNYTQFKNLSAFERNNIEQALLRYCELDTLAMVMLVQGLMELRGTPLKVFGVIA